MKQVSSRVIVALFFHRYRWGVQIRGDERGFFEKTKEFKKFGLDLIVLEKNPSFQEDACENAYVSVKVPGCRIPPRTPFQLLPFLFCILGSTFRKIPVHPLAIYSYNQDVENVFPGLIVKILTGAPLLVVHHQIDASSVQPFGHSFVDKRKAGYGLIGAIWRSILPAINRFALLQADIHIALSQAAKEDVEQAVGISNCVVIGNGVDTGKFRPLTLRKTHDAVFLGRLAPQKGIDLLLKAWSKVIQTIPSAKLMLIGGADKAYFKQYQDMLLELGIQDSVMITGFQSDEKVVEFLNSSKLFVFPSRKEGFAQAVSQAMSCGMCCILSDIPALREYYGKSAVLVPPENNDTLASVITELLSNESRMNEISKGSRDQVIGLSWETTARRELKTMLEFRKQEKKSAFPSRPKP